MLKRLVQVLLLQICATGTAFAVDCASNEFKYIDNNNNETCIENKFQITTTNDTDKFVFTMTAKGTFYIDWGDGDVEMINRTNTTMTEYSHDYASANEYIIKFGGLATEYTKNSDAYQLPHRSCIFFGSPTENDNVGVNNTYDKLAGISGSLGAIFRTLGNTMATQPNFMYVFRGCSNLTSSIPENLFSGISGSTVSNMFTRTFMGCSGLTGTDIDDPNNPGKKYAIPPNLFSGLSRVAAGGTFLGTFSSCTGLTGTIPGTLFNIQTVSANTQSLFHTTFNDCTNLTGPIPANLFTKVVGVPKGYLFYHTFTRCSGLTGTDIDDPDNPGMKYAIPPTLFAGISGAPYTGTFDATFSGCSGLTGTIPKDLFKNIFGAPANSMFYGTFQNCSGLTGPIPEKLFNGISGKPAGSMFYHTFYNCSGLTGTDIDDPDNPGMKYAIPPTLFAGISGAPATNMFLGTFYGCSELSGTIPGTLFSGVSGAPMASMFQEIFRHDSKIVGPIPSNLFSGIVGKLADSSFTGTFNGCTNLGKDAVGGTSMYYVPPELFAGIDKTSVTSGMMTSIFDYTGLLTTCPSGTTQYITGFETYFGGKKSCTECPVAYPDYDATNQQCYAQVSYMDSDNDSLYKTENVYYDANNPNGFNLPSYTPTNNPDTVFNNWELGDGTAIASNDVLAGNQVVYTKWRFHCDSGKYFHAGNEQICAAETKRTEHAFVIQPDANHTYYIHATPNSEHDYTINSSSVHKLKTDYNGTIYNLHDASVYYDN